MDVYRVLESTSIFPEFGTLSNGGSTNEMLYSLSEKEIAD
jgi:hypothetical protein